VFVLDFKKSILLKNNNFGCVCFSFKKNRFWVARI